MDHSPIMTWGRGPARVYWQGLVYTFIKVCAYSQGTGNQHASRAMSAHASTFGKLQATKLRSLSSHFLVDDVAVKQNFFASSFPETIGQQHQQQQPSLEIAGKLETRIGVDV